MRITVNKRQEYKQKKTLNLSDKVGLVITKTSNILRYFTNATITIVEGIFLIGLDKIEIQVSSISEEKIMFTFIFELIEDRDKYLKELNQAISYIEKYSPMEIPKEILLEKDNYIEIANLLKNHLMKLNAPLSQDTIQFTVFSYPLSTESSKD